MNLRKCDVHHNHVRCSRTDRDKTIDSTVERQTFFFNPRCERPVAVRTNYYDFLTYATQAAHRGSQLSSAEWYSRTVSDKTRGERARSDRECVATF